MADISVVGTGYVGLTTGACLAQIGHNVVCADVNAEKIAMLQAGRVPILERGLEEIVGSCLALDRLSFVSTSREAVESAEFHHMCLPTPQGADGAADLTYLMSAIAEIAEHIPSRSVVVNKSTVPVGTTEEVARVLGRADVDVVSNPEFLREGSAVDDFLNPDRVVVGAASAVAASRVASLYESVEAPLLVTDPCSAEAIKYASNAFLAMKLSFVNSVANMCEAVGADVQDVATGMGLDSRIGSKFLEPGPGWGGSCFPKDTNALRWMSRACGYEFQMLDEVLSTNQAQFDRIAQKIIDCCASARSGQHVAMMGLTFKAGTDDLRDSPAIEVARRVRDVGISIKAYDPAIRATDGVLERLHPNLGIEVVEDPYGAADGAAVLAILTEWDEFSQLELDKLGQVMACRQIVDGRNMLDGAAAHARGFRYRGVGLRPIDPPDGEFEWEDAGPDASVGWAVES